MNASPANGARVPSSTAAEPALTIVAHDIGGPGGMERVLGELISGLLAAGYRITVVSRTLRLPPHERLEWTRVPAPSRPFPIAYPWFFVLGTLLTWRTRQGALLTTGAIVANRSDWCAVHFCHRASRGLALSRASRRTLSYRFNERIAQWLSRAGEALVFRPGRIGGAISVSKGLSTEIAEHFPNLRCETVPNGVSLERFKPDVQSRQRVRQDYGLGPEELVALFVGGEWEGKGLRPALEALVDAPEWTLLVLGEGDIHGFAARAEELGVRQQVIFAGVADDPAPFYSASDAFVLPTRYETFSLVSYEAAAAGLPLLVTPVNGVTDLLEDGRQGWFIASDPNDIASKLNALAADGDLRESMGRAGRAAASEFTWSRMVSGYAALLQR